VYITSRLHSGTDREAGGSSWGARGEARREGGGRDSPHRSFFLHAFSLHPSAFFLELWNKLSKDDSSKHAYVRRISPHYQTKDVVGVISAVVNILIIFIP